MNSVYGKNVSQKPRDYLVKDILRKRKIKIMCC